MYNDVIMCNIYDALVLQKTVAVFLAAPFQPKPVCFKRPTQSQSLTISKSVLLAASATATTTTMTHKQLPQPSIMWKAELLNDEKKIEANFDNTWFLTKAFSIPDCAEFTIKAGNKDYALDLEPDNAKRQRLSEFTLKKKHG